MKPLALALVLVVFLVAGNTPLLGEVPILGFDEVKPGMTGTGRTVFEGAEISTFEVEILGKLPNIGPDQNLILGRLSGGPLERTGVMSGMSGSPVFIDGKLIGAVAYSWGFSKEPIAGITPIEEMLAIASLDADGPARVSGILTGDLERLWTPASWVPFLHGQMHALLQPVVSGAANASLPLSVSGIGHRGLSAIAPQLRDAGFLPMQAGGTGASGTQGVPLEPGAAMGLKLVRGDVEMTATGTVTWVDNDGMLAFGHPMFSLGAVDLPLTGADVQALLPSLHQSARMAIPTSEVGALRQDRASGVFGRLGASAQMIPVRLQLSPAVGPERTYSFDVADDPLLAPLLLHYSISGILAGRERRIGNATVRLREGSVIKMMDGDDVELDNLFSGPQAFEYGTGIPAYILYLLMNNAWTPPRVVGINLILDYAETPKTGRIRRAALDRYSAHPGDSIQATVVVSPYRGPDQVLTREIKIPDETPAGRVRVQIGSAVAVSRAEEHNQPLLPRDLKQLVDLINQLRRNDRIYIVASREDPGVMLGGTRLPNLPPSVASVLSRPTSRGNFTVIPRRALFEANLGTDYAVEGWAEVTLEVLEP